LPHEVSRSPNPDRIVFVLPHFGVGGAEKQLANLITHRPRVANEIDVHTVTFLPPTSEYVVERFQTAGARNTLIDRSAMAFPSFFFQLYRTLRRLNPVIVSTILDSSVGAWGRLAALLAGVPLIVHSDRALAPEGSRVHFLLRPHLDRRTDLFLPNAHAVADRLVKDGVKRERIRVIPNGVDLEAFDPSKVLSNRGALGVPKDAVVLGYLGRFASVKRLDILMSSLQLLDLADRPDRVILAGDGPTMSSVREAVLRDPWLEENCVFLGTIDSTPEFLATIDYLVLPSESEGLPNVVLEAMAMQKPVVSTRVSDVPIILGDTGFIAEPSNADSLANAILSMQKLGPRGRADLGRKGRVRVESEYSMEVAANRFWAAHLDLIEDYLRGRRTTR